jgi:adenylosuccinate lyase
MIQRYVRPEMAEIWSEERRLALWLEVEIAPVETREAAGEVPAGTVARIRRSARIDAQRMRAIELEVQHDVIAFLSMVSESVGNDARLLHAGLTSSDVVDTALACQIQQAGRLLLEGLSAVRRAAYGLAERHRMTPMVGRTHGVHAEPITFGLKCLVWSEELGRGIERVERELARCAVGKLSGAVGTLAHLRPEVERDALARLGLSPEPVANQVVQRDRHAGLLAALAVVGGTMDKIALEIRHLMRTEVREVEEPFGRKQKGSSAMPHKRNPVRCERICGLARLLRSHALVAFENQPLWHERDISHSSAERVIFPDAFAVADFMAADLAAVLENLVVRSDRMRANLDAGGGLVFSQRVLLALTEAGLSRDEAYALVQEHALAALDGQGGFRERLASDGRVTSRLEPPLLERCFALEPYLAGVDALFARAERPT